MPRTLALVSGLKDVRCECDERVVAASCCEEYRVVAASCCEEYREKSRFGNCLVCARVCARVRIRVSYMYDLCVLAYICISACMYAHILHI